MNFDIWSKYGGNQFCRQADCNSVSYHPKARTHKCHLQHFPESLLVKSRQEEKMLRTEAVVRNPQGLVGLGWVLWQ